MAREIFLGKVIQVKKMEVLNMAAGKCKSAYHTDEYHGYGCNITEGPCMFLFPDSKMCAEKYGEGPDAGNTENDNVVKDD